MKVKVISDLHLEFLSEFSVQELGRRVARTPADVLVLAGDICPLKSKRWKAFLDEVKMSFGDIIWVPGNHEYYGSNFKLIKPIHARRIEEYIDEQHYDAANIHYLDNKCVTIDGVQFIGSTLWTDFDKRNPTVMAHVQANMNDFYSVKYNGRRMHPNDQFNLHNKAKAFIFSKCRTGTREGLINFVVTHHGPSWLSVAEKFKRDQFSILFNGAFVSALDEAIMTHDIHTWVHGHTHCNFSYQIEGTHVFVNPHGYHDENAFGFNPDALLEVK